MKATDKTDATSKQRDNDASSIRGGVIWGVIFGVFVVGSYVMYLTPSEFRDTSKFGLLACVTVFVVIGAVFGEKFMEKLGEWLQWFF